MGIACQQSCYLVPDSKVKNPTKKLKKSTLRKLVRRRRKQMDAVLEETRLWALSVLVPHHIVSEEPEFCNELRRITTLLFGERIDEQKIKCAFRKIGCHILLPGLSNLDVGETYPQVVPEEQLLRASEDQYVLSRTITTLDEDCPEFRVQFPDARTWKDMKRHAGPQFTIYGEPLLDWLRVAQRDTAAAALGLPCVDQFREPHKIYSKLRSPNPQQLNEASTTKLDFSNADFIAVRALPKEDGTVIASMWDYNVMDLLPAFYADDHVDSVRDLRLVPDVTDVRDLSSREETIIHEITHSESSISTDDHYSEYTDEELQSSGEAYLIKHCPEDVTNSGQSSTEVPISDAKPDLTTARTNSIMGYGLEGCLKLARRDDADGTTKAEDNADSWALFDMMCGLLLANPELDCMDSSFKVKRRKNIAHSCSLYQCM
ncbi:hypothetical protein PMZ80_008121 [Knufia obscura]|uniref:Uncharacterized protein n=1 Tax=Knufia obscura TaxID=1635080 RepID=A0ABR0RHQ3_9EURO|nr:hypothetical protein PMZ80_008121 [Knufia obscura]